MRSINYTVAKGTTIESTSNVLVVVLYSFIATNHRGFVIDYDTAQPSRKTGTDRRGGGRINKKV